MVFGWGKKKNDVKVEEKIQQETMVKLDEIPKILDDLQKLRTKTIIAEVKSFRKKILPQLDELQKIAKTLEKDDLNVDDIDIHLKLLVVRGKEQVITMIKKETGKKFGDISSYQDVAEFNNEMMQILKKIGDVLGRQSRVIHIFAKKYADKLKTILSSLNSDKEELVKITKNYETFQNEVNEITSLLSELKQMEETRHDKEKRIDEITKSISELDEKIIKDNKKIEEIKSSDEYSNYQEIKKTIQNLEPEKTKIKHEVNDQFTKISRPLGKYQYVSSLEKEQKSLLAQLEENPFQVLKPELKTDIIVILQAVRKGVQGGSVSVKDVEKSIQYLDETTEMLDSLIKKAAAYYTKHEELEKKLKTFDVHKLDSIESELEKTKKDKEDFESRLNEINSEIAELAKEKPRITLKIQSLLQSASSIKYTID